MTEDRLQEVRHAVKTWADMDPSEWGTGLSKEGCRLAQSIASQAILEGQFQLPATPPKQLMIWCSSNVFTAPLEWVAQFTAMGTRVVLKAPSLCPKPVLALEKAFSGLNVHAHHVDLDSAFDLLEGCDAVLGFGSDASMNELESRLAPSVARSLHGHRASLAIVRAEDPEQCAKGLIKDTVLYDSRGCMSPIAVFCLGDSEALFEAVVTQADSHQVPIGQLSLAEKAHLSRRGALAKMLGTSGSLPLQRCGNTSKDTPFGVTPLLIDKEHFEFLSLPRLIPIHPIEDLSELDFLKGLAWSSCATDLPHQELKDLAIPRLCRPGELQSPPMNRRHDGVDVLAKLCG